MEDYSFLDYELPEGRIAQRPIGKGEGRANSKLLHAQVVDSAVRISDNRYSDLPGFLRSGDLLVLNDTRVVPCRFFIQPDASHSEIEILLVRRRVVCGDKNIWEALARPMKRLKEGKEYQLSADVSCIVGGRSEDGNRVLLEIRTKDNSAFTDEALMPIPPYIRGGHADQEDRESYQTVFARESGSIAAPTAGLHFTPKLLKELEDKGVKCCYVTLHVGAASFTPIRDCEVKSHQMTSENYEISPETASKIYRAKREGRRVVVVGTTSLRALESAVRTKEYCFIDGSGDSEQLKTLESGVLRETNLFITPGFDFRVADVLVTNFHQPRSTHLLLVAAFIGAGEVRDIYSYALGADYRFLSYGDGMILFPEKRK